jgi:ubiquinone/menaquinone biosynthesis C-methylase UbiE
MKRIKPTKFNKITNDDFSEFLKKLEFQAIETAEERIPLYLRIGIKDAGIILDVGCGSGIVTRDLAHLTNGFVIGIDESADMIHEAKRITEPYTNIILMVGSAEHLPFPDNTFDITTCNLVLMWTIHPQGMVNEMARVTKPNGCVLASLEPDYGGKLHFPEDHRIDPIFAGQAIRDKGGDPHIGRKLRSLFVKAGLETEVGIGNNRIWSCEEDKAYYFHARDFYVKALQNAGLSQDEIDQWEYNYLNSLDQGVQLNFFPQFYAIGRKRKPTKER